MRTRRLIALVVIAVTLTAAAALVVESVQADDTSAVTPPTLPSTSSSLPCVSWQNPNPPISAEVCPPV
jgi:hypothetical protein